MNGQIYPQQVQPQVTSTSVEAQFVQYIMPVLISIMFLVFIAGMIRDLFKGEEVKLPLD